MKTVTLTFSNPDVTSKYDTDGKEVTLQFLKIFIYFALFHTICLNIKLLIEGSYLRLIWVNIEAFGYIIPLFLQKYLVKLKKVTLDAIFCSIIMVIYLVHLEYIIVPIILMMKGSPEDHFILFFLGVSIEIFRIFLYIARVRWTHFCISNLLITSMLLRHLLESPYFKDMLLVQFFPLVVGNYVAPLILMFLKEKNEKAEFLKQKNYEKFYKSYENLISTMIPDPILILSSTKPEILFCNEATHETFQTERLDQVLEQMSEIEVYNLEMSTNTNLLDVYKHHLSHIFNTNSYETYEGIFSKSCCMDGSVSRSGSGKMNSNGTTKEFMFNIKLIKIYWRESKAFLILLNDTSSAFQYKKMKEITQYKDKILATFSHDLRSPLSGIVGLLEIASEYDNLDRKLQEILQNALNSAKTLKFLVNDIIDFTCFTRKQLTLNRTHEKISESVLEVMKIVQHQVKEKGLDFLREIPEETLNTLIFTDSNRIKQLLLNLLNNAIKFTYKGFIKVKVTIEPTEHIVCFAVEDSGIGIPEENLKKLFTLFEKNDIREADDQRAGLGFGLVISQILAIKLSPFEKGITVESSVGNGSQFRFSVPLSESFSDSENEIALERKEQQVTIKQKYNMKIHFLAETLRSPVSQSPLVKKNSASCRILLVDDDMINIMVHSQYLRKFNLDFDTAYNGKEALDIIKKMGLRKEYYAVVLMDCNMPIMDGFEASEKIQEMIRKKEIPNLCIMAVTANASFSHIEKCTLAGMSHFLEKPVSLEKLKESLEKILRINLDF